MELPFTISNIHGEEITFLRMSKNEKGEDVLELENKLKPGAGPPMHVHFKQDESLTIVEGEMCYQELGGEEKHGKAGDTVTFKAGVPHKFRNSGSGLLHCKGWISPPNTIMYFLAEIYKSTNENNGRPGTFDAAYLLDRYKGEYEMYDIPAFVRKVIFPVSLFIGKVQGKHKKYADAPEPV